MITIKSEDELSIMREAGAIVAQAFALAERLVAPEVETDAIDRAVETFIRDSGGVPAFKGYRGFRKSVCASVNEEVVHGIPGPRRLEEGDLLKLDVGVQLRGWFADSARTIPIGRVRPVAVDLMATCRAALDAGIGAVRPGARLQDLAQAIEHAIRTRGYAVVEKYVGHGIGRELHEPPQVPNFYRRNMFNYDVVLSPGMTLAIEPMVNEGSPEVEQLDDGWTVVTSDRKLSTHYEHTVAVTESGFEVLTVAGGDGPGPGSQESRS